MPPKESSLAKSIAKGVLGAVAAFAVLVLMQSITLSRQSSAKPSLDPSLGMAESGEGANLILREQKEHPVTEEMWKSAEALKGIQAPDFTLPDADGVSHSLSDFRKKGPVLIFFIEKECPCCVGAKFFVDKMRDLYGDVLTTIGIINADANVTKVWQKATNAKFQVLMDPEMAVIQSYKAERGVYTALVAPDGTLDKAYPGYSLDMLQDMSKRISQLAKVPFRKVVSAAAPKKMTSGCSFPEPKKKS